MKKTLSIHLGRMLFVIEEDAYDRLQQYLQRLEHSLQGEDGIAEIIEDIEMRFAELLTSYLGETRKVVTLTDVEQGASSLGEPEEFTEDNGNNRAQQEQTQQEQTAQDQSYTTSGRSTRLLRDSENGKIGGVCAGIANHFNIDRVIARVIFVVLFFLTFGLLLYIVLWLVIPEQDLPANPTNTHAGRNSRRLFRDKENGRLGGVCAGLAAYLKVDTALMRVFFVILFFFFFGFLLYLLLWITIPAAETPSERLQMQGKAVTVDSLKEEFSKERLKASFEPSVARARNFLSAIGRLIGLGMLGGAFLWLTFFLLMITGIIEIIPTTGDSEYASFFEFMHLVIPVTKSYYLMQAGVLLVGLSGPIIAILIGIRLLVQKPHKVIKISLLVFPALLFLGLILGMICGIQTGRDFAVYEKIERQHLQFNGSELSIEEMPHFYNNHRIVSSGGVDFIHISGKSITQQGVTIKYRPSQDSLFHISHIVSAHAVDKTAALNRSGRIRHTIALEGNKLLIDPYYTFPSKDGLRDQEIEVIIEVPRYKKLKIKNQEMKDADGEYFGSFYANEPFEAYTYTSW